MHEEVEEWYSPLTQTYPLFESSLCMYVGFLLLTFVFSSSSTGDSKKDEVKAATQLTAALMPITNTKSAVEFITITDEMKDFSAYKQVRKAREVHNLIGILASAAWKNSRKLK